MEYVDVLYAKVKGYHLSFQDWIQHATSHGSSASRHTEPHQSTHSGPSNPTPTSSSQKHHTSNNRATPVDTRHVDMFSKPASIDNQPCQPPNVSFLCPCTYRSLSFYYYCYCYYHYYCCCYCQYFQSQGRLKQQYTIIEELLKAAESKPNLLNQFSCSVIFSIF